MTVNYPDYYREFQCIGGMCPDTCCGGWQIGIDEKTCRRYKRENGEFGKRLRKSIDFKNRCFIMEGSGCPFLNKEKLCDIYRHLGKESLCNTCRDYPRHMEVYDGLREISLSLSCPEAARIILEKKGKFSLIQKKGGSYEKEGRLLAILVKARRVMFDIMENEYVDMNVRYAMILAMAHDMQLRLDKGKWEQIKEVLERYSAEGAAIRFEKKISGYRERTEEKRQHMSVYAGILKGLEGITEIWPGKLGRVCEFLEDKKNYEKVHRDYFNYYRNNWYVYGNLMIYFLYVYFLGAVYDEQAYGKVKLAAVSCLMIQEMGASLFMEKGSFDGNDMVEEAHVYSREIEHSDFNLEGLERVLVNSSMFGLEKLLVCILS